MSGSNIRYQKVISLQEVIAVSQQAQLGWVMVNLFIRFVKIMMIQYPIEIAFAMA